MTEIAWLTVHLWLQQHAVENSILKLADGIVVGKSVRSTYWKIIPHGACRYVATWPLLRFSLEHQVRVLVQVGHRFSTGTWVGSKRSTYNLYVPHLPSSFLVKGKDRLAYHKICTTCSTVTTRGPNSSILRTNGSILCPAAFYARQYSMPGRPESANNVHIWNTELWKKFLLPFFSC